jgi:hypothetical protein
MRDNVLLVLDTNQDRMKINQVSVGITVPTEHDLQTQDMNLGEWLTYQT